MTVLARMQYIATRLRQLSWHKRLLLAEAVVLLGLARSIVLLLPFKRIAPWLGQLNTETPATFEPDQQRIAHGVRWSISLVSRHTPWNSNCLAQAIAAKLMLQRRAVKSTLYLGVSKDGSSLRAHAWLRTGSMIVTGDEARPAFTTLTSFGVKS